MDEASFWWVPSYSSPLIVCCLQWSAGVPTRGPSLGVQGRRGRSQGGTLPFWYRFITFIIIVLDLSLSQELLIRRDLLSATKCSSKYAYTNMSHDLLTVSHDLLTVSHDLLTVSHDLLTVSHDLLTVSHDLLTVSHDFLTVSHGIAGCGSFVRWRIARCWRLDLTPSPFSPLLVKKKWPALYTAASSRSRTYLWVSEWAGGRVGERMGGWVSGWVSTWVSGWVGGWVSEWMGGRASKWVGEWVGGWVSEQESIPFW